MNERRGAGPGARQERGSNLVEAAIVLPTLLLLLAGVADIGRAFREYIVLTGAAREGARYAAYFPSQQNLIEDHVLQAASDAGVTLARSNVLVTRIQGTGADEAVRVTATRQVALLLGGVVGLHTLTISSFAEMPILDPDR